MRQTLKVKEELSFSLREPTTNGRELSSEPELAHLRHDSLASSNHRHHNHNQQQARDKQQEQYQHSVKFEMSAESREQISSVSLKQEPDEVKPAGAREEGTTPVSADTTTTATATATTTPTATATTTATTSSVVGMEGASGNRCAGCREPIRDKFIFSVIDLNWHQDCVQCADCLLKLNERCHTYDGKLYCRQDYWRRFGPKCFACSESIERKELVQIIKGNQIYHLKCFTCNECNKQLKAGEQLHLIDGKRLLCKQDYHHQQLNGCSIKSPAGFHHTTTTATNNNNNNSNGKSFQPQQHTISSATYYTLMSSQKQQQQQQQDAQEQTISRRPTQGQNKIERHHHQASLSPDLDEVGADCTETAMEGFDEELDGDEEVDGDEVDLEEEGASLDGMLGFDATATAADNNLENEENRSVLAGGRFNQQQESPLDNHLNLNLNHHGHHNHLHHHQMGPGLSGGQRALRRSALVASAMAEGDGVKRRRRRRKKLQTAAGDSSGGAAIAGGDPAVKRLTHTGRGSGESILNGLPPASSILALQSATPASQQQQQFAPSQQQQLLNQKSVPSSAASTASNSSTSSSLSVSQLQQQQQSGNNGSSHHPHAHQQQHSHSQQRSQQQQQQQQHHHQDHRSSSGGGQSGGGHKPTRVRTVLNEKQLQTLRDCYAHNPRPDALMKEQLVEMTGLSSRVIRVWFQNKRCKDKKKSIQHKQMLQYEKDGRHLAGLTLMRGVPMVASSPIQYDEHSTISSTPGAQQSASAAQGTTMLELQPTATSAAGQQQQQQQDSAADRAGGRFGPAPSSVQHSPAQAAAANSAPQPVDIHAYQPPWKNLVEYANHGATPPERLNTASPRYQQLIGQIHGYNSTGSRQTEAGAELVSMAELQVPQVRNQFQQQQPQSQAGFSSPSAMDQQQQQHSMGHLHQPQQF